MQFWRMSLMSIAESISQHHQKRPRSNEDATNNEFRGELLMQKNKGQNQRNDDAQLINRCNLGYLTHLWPELFEGWRGSNCLCADSRQLSIEGVKRLFRINVAEELLGNNAIVNNRNADGAHEHKKLIRKLRLQGNSYRFIAEKLQLKPSTISNYCLQYGIGVPKREPPKRRRDGTVIVCDVTVTYEPWQPSSCFPK